MWLWKRGTITVSEKLISNCAYQSVNVATRLQSYINARGFAHCLCVELTNLGGRCVDLISVNERAPGYTSIKLGNAFRSLFFFFKTMNLFLRLFSNSTAVNFKAIQTVMNQILPFHSIKASGDGRKIWSHNTSFGHLCVLCHQDSL
jgi:hypothetical protein